MFENNLKDSIPGYTGHLKTNEEEEYLPGKSEAKKQIPGMITSNHNTAQSAAKTNIDHLYRLWRICARCQV